MARTASPGPPNTRPSTPRTHPHSRPAPHRTPTASSRSPARPTAASPAATPNAPQRAPPSAAHAPTHAPRTRAADRPQRLRQRPPTDLLAGPLRIERLPQHREGLHRLRDPLQLEVPDRLDPRALDQAREQLGRQRHEDPVRWRLVTQPRRLDRRHPEVIAVLDRRLTRPQPDPHMEALLGMRIAPFEQLLRQHR